MTLFAYLAVLCIVVLALNIALCRMRKREPDEHREHFQ